MIEFIVIARTSKQYRAFIETTNYTYAYLLPIVVQTMTNMIFPYLLREVLRDGNFIHNAYCIYQLL